MRNVKQASLGELLESFFNKRLIQQQNVTQNTIDSYRDTWRLLLRYLVTQKGLPISSLTVDMVSAEVVLNFLDHLEKDRKCGASTRNQRRAAIRAFAKHVILHEPKYMAQFERILSIPTKNCEKKLLGYLTEEEMDSIFATFDRNTPDGRRNYALLMLMYNVGARVSEITAVKCKDVGTEQILIHGKGSKERIVPIWPETVKLLNNLIVDEELNPEQKLFQNNRKKPITRSGITYILNTATTAAVKNCASLQGRKISPHTIRHTTAMHLLQSGADLNLIRMWLGHVHLDTTHGYVEADIKMKRKTLENGGISKPDSGYTWKPTDDVKAFLDTLGVK
ncbi:MAG TPA: tyrosine-type recombinase/integrase [Spirochaetales bacterium]|jgi:integrase/recombinase XerD|nr:tyrosine-type recombinase/integrase [Spirochaetales bacterium]